MAVAVATVRVMLNHRHCADKLELRRRDMPAHPHVCLHHCITSSGLLSQARACLHSFLDFRAVPSVCVLARESEMDSR